MKRNPAIVLLLSIATFGAYGVYWYWQVNEELRNRGVPVRPAVSALAVSWGMLLLIPAVVSCYLTAKRIRSLGGKGPSLAIALLSLPLLFYPAYIQTHMNRLEPSG
jgi:hypothetical protein